MSPHSFLISRIDKALQVPRLTIGNLPAIECHATMPNNGDKGTQVKQGPLNTSNLESHKGQGDCSPISCAWQTKQRPADNVQDDLTPARQRASRDRAVSCGSPNRGPDPRFPNLPAENANGVVRSLISLIRTVCHSDESGFPALETFPRASPVSSVYPWRGRPPAELALRLAWETRNFDTVLTRGLTPCHP